MSAVRDAARALAATSIAIALALLGPVAQATPAAPTAGKAPAPAATPCPKPTDPIAIDSVTISEDPILAGTSVSGTVVATCNVAAVTAQVGTFRIGVPKRSPGIFTTTVEVPHLVWPGRFKLVVTAIRTDGFSVAKTIPITVRW